MWSISVSNLLPHTVEYTGVFPIESEKTGDRPVGGAEPTNSSAAFWDFVVVESSMKIVERKLTILAFV